MLDFGAPSPSQSLMTAGIWLGVFRTGASEGRRRKEERTEDSRGEKKVNSRTRRKRSKEGQLPPDSNTRPMPKKMSKQLREYVPEDKINDPPFLPRASLMKCVCVCSWLLNLHNILLVQPNPSNVTGRLYADKRILETRCQKSPQPGVEVLYKKCSNGIFGDSVGNRLCVLESSCIEPERWGVGSTQGSCKN